MGEEIAYLNANLAHEELPVPEKSCLGQRLGEGVRDHRHSVHVRNGDDARSCVRTSRYCPAAVACT